MLRAAAVALLATLVVGCSHSASSRPAARPPDHAMSQRWALSDGVVTRAEYRTAMLRFVSCVRAAGYRVGPLHDSPIDGLTLLYDITPSGPPTRYNTRTDACTARHLSLIEARYVESQHQVMDTSLRRAVSQCLRKRGLRPRESDRSFPDFLAVSHTGEEKNIVLACVITTTHRLFPELPDNITMRG